VNIRSRVMSRLAAAASVAVVAGGLLAASAGAAVAAPGSGSVLAHVPDRASAAAATFQIKNFESGLCLGISGGGVDVPAVQYTCNGHPDQQWHWGSWYTGLTTYQQLVNNDNVCLGVTSGSTAHGARLVGWHCLGTNHPDQYWTSITAWICMVSGEWTLSNNSGLVVGVYGDPLKVGAPLVLWGDQGTCNNQIWTGPLAQQFS
jgi:hypothetical protein